MSESFRYKLIIEYDGTNFSGWQRQNDARTVQGDLIKVTQRIFPGTSLDIQGCGRTDAGVHALEYTAHLEMDRDIAASELSHFFNDQLPKDIAVRRVQKAGPRFHARHNCVARSYIYYLSTRKSAFGKRYSWWVRDTLDIKAMQGAADCMVGFHDFISLAEKPELKKSTKALVHAVQLVEEEDGKLSVRVVGSHFLWRMVRRMVGLLVEVGCGRLTVSDIENILTTSSKVPQGHTAPAAGLFFEKAFYNDEELQRFISPIEAIGFES